MLTKCIKINYKPCSGFITLEIIIVLGLILLLSSTIQIPYSAFQKKMYPLQLQAASQTLAADIRAFQQEILFGNSTTNRIVILSDKTGYYVESANGNRYVNFNKIGCDGVYFSQTSSNYIRFSNNGAPFTAGTYVLKHKKINQSCMLTIQVASGRVDIREQ